MNKKTKAITTPVPILNNALIHIGAGRVDLAKKALEAGEREPLALGWDYRGLNFDMHPATNKQDILAVEDALLASSNERDSMETWKNYQRILMDRWESDANTQARVLSIILAFGLEDLCCEDIEAGEESDTCECGRCAELARSIYDTWRSTALDEGAKASHHPPASQLFSDDAPNYLKAEAAAWLDLVTSLSRFIDAELKEAGPADGEELSGVAKKIYEQVEASGELPERHLEAAKRMLMSDEDLNADSVDRIRNLKVVVVNSAKEEHPWIGGWDKATGDGDRSELLSMKDLDYALMAEAGEASSQCVKHVASLLRDSIAKCDATEDAERLTIDTILRKNYDRHPGNLCDVDELRERIGKAYAHLMSTSTDKITNV